jgi:hypothetical protein
VCELSERGFQDEEQGRGHDQSESAVRAAADPYETVAEKTRVDDGSSQLAVGYTRLYSRKRDRQKVTIRRNSLVHRQIMMNPM